MSELQDTYAAELRHSVQQKNRWHRIVLATCSVVQGTAVYFGLGGLMTDTGFAGTTIPIVVGLGTAIVLYMTWDIFFTNFPLLHSPVRQVMAAAFAIVMGLATVGMSSWFIAAAIGGDQAIVAHQQDYVKEATRQFETALHNSKHEDAVQTKALEISAYWRAKAEGEEKFGSSKTKPGAGPDALLLTKVAANAQAFAAHVQAKRDEADALYAQGSTLIADMGNITEPHKFIAEAAKLKALLVKLDATTAAPDAMNLGIVIPESRSDDHYSIEKQTTDLRKVAKEVIGEHEKIVFDAFVPMSPAIAVIRHAGAAPGGWIVGVVLDLVPMILLLAMMMLHGEAREPFVRRTPFAPSADVVPMRRPAE